MANFVASSGYDQLKNQTPLGQGVVYAGTIIDRNFEDDFLYYVTNNTVLDELTRCGQIVSFRKPPRVGGWRTYELNQELQFDQPQSESGCLSICNAAYKAIKIDEVDIYNLCNDWAAYEQGFLEDAWRGLSNLWHENALTGMLAAVPNRNQGHNAGLYQNINLGTVANPLELDTNNFVDFMSNIQRLMYDNGRLNPGEMFMIAPPLLQTLLMRTAWDKMLCCNFADSVLFNGLVANDIMDFMVIQTNRLKPYRNRQTRKFVWPIIFGWRDAYAFTGDIIKAEITNLERSFGVTYKMLTVYGGGSMYNEALGVAYVTFSIDGEMPA